MRRLCAFFCFSLLFSCELLGPGKPDKEQLMEQEMKNINWNEVDRYPLFDNCSETADKELQKNCFQDTFVSHLMDTLQEHQIVVHKMMNDTVNVQLLIGSDGTISVVSIEKSQNVQKQIPQLDSLLEVSLHTLPKLYPALKRNIPVATRMKLPVVLKAE